MKRDVLTVDPKRTVFIQTASAAGEMNEAFRKQFTGLRDDFKAKRPRVGDSVRTETDNGIVYTLVDRASGFEATDINGLALSVQNLKKQMVANGEQVAAMPMVGKRVDGVYWSKAEDVIVNQLKETDIALGVCHSDSVDGFNNIDIKSLDFSKEKPFRMALTGHRPKDFNIPDGEKYNLNHPVYDKLRTELYDHASQKLEENGKITIISGMALGADTVWAEVAARLKNEHPDSVRFEAHSPIATHADKWPRASQQHFNELLASADTQVLYASDYSPSAMQVRNCGMIYNCDELVAAYNGYSKQRSGTANALSYAKKIGKETYYTSTEYFAPQKEVDKSIEPKPKPNIRQLQAEALRKRKQEESAKERGHGGLSV